MEVKELISAAWGNRELLKENQYAEAVRSVIEEIDKGRLRVATPADDKWIVNEWIKQAILMYFGIQKMQTWSLEPFEFYDKMLLKKNYKDLGVRAVPHAVARYGAYIAKNVVLMPSYVNIGAYVDEGTMVDTWATVGSCAQIGKGVHLSGGVGIGGVLEPLQASPVIIEDGIGHRQHAAAIEDRAARSRIREAIGQAKSARQSFRLVVVEQNISNAHRPFVQNASAQTRVFRPVIRRHVIRI